MSSDLSIRVARVLAVAMTLLAIAGIALLIVGGILGRCLGVPASYILWPSVLSWLPIALYGGGLLIERGWSRIREGPGLPGISQRTPDTLPILVRRLLLGLLIVAPLIAYVAHHRLQQGFSLIPSAHW